MSDFAKYASMLTTEERYRVEERAAIIEFCGNASRAIAEQCAIEQHKRQRGAHS